MSFNIAIIGAGPTGCMLARLLQHRQSPTHPISVTIFESEARLDVRSQGGTLDLHESTGQAALRSAGLFDAFREHARYDGEAIKITDKHLLCYVRQNGASQGKSVTGRPEIDRPKLRQLLFDSIAPDTVRWGKKVARVDAGARAVHFADGTVEAGFDLIVGADGAWSHVRPAVSDVKPFYSGLGGYSLIISDAEKRHPELYELVNRGSVFAFSDGKSIMPQYMGDGSINVGVWAQRDEHWQRDKGRDVRDPEAVRRALREEYHDWDPRLLAFTQQADDDVVPRDLYMLPVGHRWEHVPGVTLVGDAAHVMTPFAGEGVNLGLKDTMKLADAILSAAGGDKAQLDQNVADFEKDMFTRATETQQLTVDMMTSMYFTPGAPRTGIERYIIRAVEGEIGPIMTTLITPLVYTWFFIFKLIW